MADPKLFPSIGAIANQADNFSDEPTANRDGTDQDRPVQQIESLCMSCGEQGITQLLLTSIPFFRELIVMSFRCDHCGATNNEIQSGGIIRPEGTVHTARILSRSDLNRQIVRSPSCSIIIPEYTLTLPATSRGQLTTVEGLVREIVTDLGSDQPLRRVQELDAWEKIEALLGNLQAILSEESDDGTGKTTEPEAPMPEFTIILDDPAGNSFIEFVGSMADPKWNIRTYKRTKQDNITLGLVAEDDDARDREEDEEGAREDPNEEVYVFHGVCSSCGHPLDTLMKKVSVPYFKDILIMSTNCDKCGYRDNEVKSGSAISPMGKRITLRVEDRDDLSRDILKSESAGLVIPEIELELRAGTLGGRFTTVEGILEQVYEELSQKVFAGDSNKVDLQGRLAFEVFLGRLKELKSASIPFTLVLDDPLANSYVQSLFAPDPDTAITIEMYERTWQQNEDLGLNDMQVEGYEDESTAM